MTGPDRPRRAVSEGRAGMGADHMANEPLRAPSPYFGGKSVIAPLVWQRFGQVSNYVECGYHEPGLFPETWECVRWKARGGYGSQGNGRGRQNAEREAVWFSPSCLRPDRPVQGSLFEVVL